MIIATHFISFRRTKLKEANKAARQKKKKDQVKKSPSQLGMIFEMIFM